MWQRKEAVLDLESTSSFLLSQKQKTNKKSTTDIAKTPSKGNGGSKDMANKEAKSYKWTLLAWARTQKRLVLHILSPFSSLHGNKQPYSLKSL